MNAAVGLRCIAHHHPVFPFWDVCHHDSKEFETPPWECCLSCVPLQIIFLEFFGWSIAFFAPSNSPPRSCPFISYIFLVKDLVEVLNRCQPLKRGSYLFHNPFIILVSCAAYWVPVPTVMFVDLKYLGRICCWFSSRGWDRIWKACTDSGSSASPYLPVTWGCGSSSATHIWCWRFSLSGAGNNGRWQLHCWV